ncbi:MAG: hypothetical protein J6U66_13150 [Lachnospiraceae bacterium]|nr:hypothetical protein [Lachnospiraceae bacterium]
MDKLPDQRELITLLRDAYAKKALTYDKLVALLPDNEKKLSKSTVQRLFGPEDPAALNCEYNTLFILGEILIDSHDIHGRTVLLHYKKELIESLELENSHLKDRLDREHSLYADMATVRSDQMYTKDFQIDKLFEFIAKSNAQIEQLTQLLDRKEDQISALLNQLITKCETCPLRK